MQVALNQALKVTFGGRKNLHMRVAQANQYYQQAAEEQMYAIAMNNFAKRINGRVNSETNIKFVNDVKTTLTTISYKVTDTKVTQHLEEERSTYVYNSKQYTFVKLKMPKIVFDQLLAQNTVATVND